MKLFRIVSCVCLEISLHIWATGAFLNSIGWAIRKRRFDGWEPVHMVWYDTMLGGIIVFTPMVASMWFMYNLVTSDTMVL